MKKSILIVGSLAVFIALIQLIRPESLPNKPMARLTTVPENIHDILRTSCFDCHSSQTNLKWFDQITPANFLVNDHIRKGRAALDFSGWDTLPAAQQNGLLSYAVNKVLEGEMPVPSYTFIHRDAQLSPQQIALLKQFLVARTPRKISDTAQIHQADTSFQQLQQSKLQQIALQIAPSPNGIAYIPNYRNWHAISTTDRFDNGTMRIIFGNDIVVQAIAHGQTNPWPNGAIFAKTAWKQLVNSDGSISSGEFIQVEFMIKDAQKYAPTKGWGWARWKGNDLKPYGKNALFTTECTSCHQPAKNNDFVFTEPLNLHLLISKSK